MCYLSVDMCRINVFLHYRLWPINWLLYMRFQARYCLLCRLSLPDAQIRKPMFVSGLATLLDIPEISMISALREANLISPPQNEADDDD